MTLLVFGGNGQLGKQLAAALKATPIFRARCDFAHATREDIEALLLKERPALILNAAAFAAVDDAEKQKPLATRVNATVPGWIAEIAARQRIPFIHYSTDYVFDGEQGAPYAEGARTNPINHYGASKCEGEQRILSANPQAAIFRLQLLYDAQGNSFFCRMRALMKEKSELKVAADQLASPTPVGDVVTATMQAVPLVLTQKLHGVYHMVSGGFTSRHGFVCAMREELLRRELPCATESLLPIVSEEFPTPAPRPKDVRLRSDALAAAGIILPHWRDGLTRVMDAVV
jgi:dTDP-4-dehydrorhamnose reductase